MEFTSVPSCGSQFVIERGKLSLRESMSLSQGHPLFARPRLAVPQSARSWCIVLPLGQGSVWCLVRGWHLCSLILYQDAPAGDGVCGGAGFCRRSWGQSSLHMGQRVSVASGRGSWAPVRHQDVGASLARHRGLLCLHLVDMWTR